MKDTGSIPAIMSTAMQKLKEVETEHMQPIAELCYHPDANLAPASVKDVKDMLNAAAKSLKSVTQYMSEAKSLVNRCKAAQKKEEEQKKDW